MVDQTVLSSKGTAKRYLDRHADRRPAGRHLGQSEMAGLGEGLSGCLPAREALHHPVAVGDQLLQRRQRDLHGAQQDQRRSLRTGTRSCASDLAKLEIDAPNGKIKLDDKRQAIAANFVTEVVEAPNGDLVNKMVKFVPETSAAARLLRKPLRQARPAEPHQSGVQEVLQLTLPTETRAGRP